MNVFLLVADRSDQLPSFFYAETVLVEVASALISGTRFPRRRRVGVRVHPHRFQPNLTSSRLPTKVGNGFEDPTRLYVGGILGRSCYWKLLVTLRVRKSLTGS